MAKKIGMAVIVLLVIAIVLVFIKKKDYQNNPVTPPAEIIDNSGNVPYPTTLPDVKGPTTPPPQE